MIMAHIAETKSVPYISIQFIANNMKNKTPWIIAFLIVCIGACLLTAVIVFRESKRTMKLTGESFQELEDLADQLSQLQSEASGTVRPSSGHSAETGSAGAKEAAAPFGKTEAESASESVFEGPSAEAIPAETEASSETETVPFSHHVIFVGDSRTVGMGKAEAHVSDHCTYIGESGEGYRWFIEDGIDLLDDAIRDRPDSPVIFNLGVNDCDLIREYLEVYHEIERAYPDTFFYYMSVNPVTEDSPHVPMADILDFNRKLKAEFPWQYIDTCSRMLRDGFDDVDGVHYTEEQYRKIHDMAVLAVISMQNDDRGI